MGQILSNLWSRLSPKSRNEAPRDDNQAKLQTSSHDEQQPQSHYINIVDHHVQSNSGSIPDEIIENRDKILDPSTSDIVVDLSRAYEREAKRRRKKKKKKEAVIAQNDQLIPEVDLEKRVTTTIMHVSSVRKIGLYTSAQTILLVGEGDFSFSACLAVAFGTSASNIVATSLNSEDFLIENYGMFITNKAKLETRGSRVLHDVDAMKMVKHPVLGSLVFNRIIFNFPHSGKFGRDVTDQRSHKNLVRGFIRNAKKMLKEDGEIHITSKSNGFFLQWDIPKIGSDQGLNLIKERKFIRSMYPGYCTKYGFGGDKDFECNPCKTYMFGLSLKQ